MSWHGKKIDPEQIHGKEEWERMKKNYTERLFQSCKSEIEEILDTAFDLPDIFKTELNVENGEIIQIPNYLSTNQHLVEFISDNSLQPETFILNGLTKAELKAEKESLENELRVIGKGCQKVFRAVATVLRDFIQSDFDRILNSDKTKQSKIDELNKLIERADDLVAFYGVRYPENSGNSGGLIYGTDIFDCLYSVRHIGGVQTVLEGKIIPQNNHFSTDQTDVSLETLEKLQNVALPKAKEFIKVQLALNRNYSSHFNSVEDQLQDPVEVANDFVNRPKYNPPKGGLAERDIAKVMEVTKSFIIKNNVQNLYGSVNTVRRNCEKLGLPGSRNSQSKYIKFYAKSNGRYSDDK